MEDPFKALSSPNRRRILDALFRSDGQTLTALWEEAEMTRQGLSRHLQVLESSGLVVTEFRGREKYHYLNPVPIRAITSRWLAKYADHQVDALVNLKNDIEGAAMNHRKAFAYQICIRAPRERVWDALTNPAFTSRYFHGTYIESDWKPGSPVFYRNAPGGEITVDGAVLEIDPPNRLVISWHVQYNDQAGKEPPSRVTFSLDEHEDQTRLKVVHDEFPEDTVLFDSISDGWPWILSSLKSLLETGTALSPEAA